MAEKVRIPSKNFSDQCFLKGATKKFLRISFLEEGDNIITGHDDNIKITVSVEPGSLSNVVGTPAKFPIRLNNVPLDEFGSPGYTTIIKTPEIKEIAYLLECDNEDAYATLVFNVDYDDQDSIGSPRPEDRTFTLKVLSFKEADNTTKYSATFNKAPLLEQAKMECNSSATLMRTDPLLTGNVKLTVSSNGDLSLNSLDANSILSNVKYKNFKVNPRSSYASDLYRFLDNGQMTADALYEVKENDYSYTKKDLFEQTDDFYQYGASQCTSEFYDEEFQFFAPLLLMKKIPEFFVIFRVKHPVSKASYLGKNDNEILKEMLEEAEVFKTFDMRADTKLGMYLRSITENARFSEDMLNVSFDQFSLSMWKGIAYDRGSYTQRGEFIYDTITRDNKIKAIDKFITEGFKRNKIVTQNIINLEFLFDDDEADLYSINRYFGLYVDKIDLERFDFNNKLISLNENQIPVLRNGKDAEKYSLVEFNQYNATGIELPVRYDENIDGEPMQNLPLESDTEKKNKFFVISDRDNNMYRIKSVEDRRLVVDGELTPFKNFTLYNTSANIAKFRGINKLVFNKKVDFISESPAQMQILLADADKHGYCVAPNETLTIMFENDEEGDKWQCIANATGTPDTECWKNSVYDISCSTYKNTFNPYGTAEECAVALAKCINSFDTTLFEAVAINDSVAIVSKHKDESGNSLRIERKFYSDVNASAVKFFGAKNVYEDSIDEKGNHCYIERCSFAGGNATENNIAVISREDSYNLKEDYYFQVKTNKYSEIKNYRTDKNPILALPYIGKPKYIMGKLVTFEDYDSKCMIELTDEVPFYTDHEKRITGYDLFYPDISLLSFYPVRDFDFSFFNSDYMYAPFGELESVFGTVSLKKGETKELEKNCIYYLRKGKVAFADRYIGSPSEDVFYTKDLIETYTGANTTVTAVTDAALIKFEYNKIKKLASSDNEDDYAVSDYIHDFKGFNTITSIVTEDDITEVEKLKNEFNIDRFFYTSLMSEYDRLEENAQKEFATMSLVVPSIVKWVSEGTDVRENQYRLNFSDAFTTTNFTPSFSVENDTSRFTHEWLCLEQFPNTLSKDYIPTSRSYMFTSIDTVVEGRNDIEKMLLNETYDYFTKYFVTGKNVSHYSDDPDLDIKKQEHYSIIHYSDKANSHYTLYRGVKLYFKELDRFGKYNGDAKDYEGYKFAAVLSRLDEGSDKAYDIRFIENKVFKTLTLIVKVDLSQTRNKVGMSYLNLYTSDSAIDYSNISFDANGKLVVEPQYKDVKMFNDRFQQSYSAVKEIYIPDNLKSKYGISFEEFTSSSYNNFKDFKRNGLPSYALVSKGEDGKMTMMTQLLNSNEKFTKVVSSESYKLDNIVNMSVNFFENNSLEASEDNSSALISDYSTYKIAGGNNYSFLDKILSFSNLKRLIEEKRYKYKTNKRDSFYFEVSFKAPSVIMRSTRLSNDIDDEISSTLKNGQVAAIKNIEEWEPGEAIYRYQGLYRPKFKNVIEFEADEDSEFCRRNKKDFLLCNTSFLDTARHAKIQNFSMNKIADTEIMQSDEYGNRIYDLPMIGMTTIMQADRSIVKSNWDKDYFIKNMNSTVSERLNGTENVKEFKSFLGSKLMNVNKSFLISTFKEGEEYTMAIERTNSQNSNLSKSNPATIDTVDKMKISIDLETKLLNEMFEMYDPEQELDWIIKNVKGSSVEKFSKDYKREYAKNYLKTNILPLYKIGRIRVYAKQSTLRENTFLDKASSLNFIREKFKEYKNFTEKRESELKTSLEIYLDPVTFNSFGIEIEIVRK